jgi:photosystem II stability/assembly factor-like uncharacterized protein
MTLLLAVALLAGCTKPFTSPPTTAIAPSPKPVGVPLSDLDLKGAPAPDIRRVDHAAGNGPGPNLTDVAFSNETDGYAVSRTGAIEKTSDGGASWSLVYQLKGGRFSRVEVAGDQAIFAAAQTGCDPGPNCEGPQVLVSSTDGGKHWTVVQPQLPALQASQAQSSSRKLDQVFSRLRFQFLSAQLGYASPDLTENYGPLSPPLLVTRDGGRNWQIVGLPPGVSFAGGFSFASPERGYITAWRSDNKEYQVLSTHDGGVTWQVLYSNGQYPLFAVDFPTAKDGYAAGGGNPKAEMQPRQVVLATHDGGATWALVSKDETNTTWPIAGLKFYSSTEGWAFRGGCFSLGANGPCGGHLLFTRDGGKTWKDTGHRVDRIESAGQRAWAIDGDGATTVQRSDDGGANWQQLWRPDAVRVSHVQFLSPQVGFIGTNVGFYQTQDGGKSWTPIPLGGHFDPHSWPLFLDQRTALGLNQSGLQRSTDGGLTWQQVAVPLPEKTDHISMPSLAVPAPVAGKPTGAWLAMESVTCMNPDCPAFLIQTSDGGATWRQVTPGPPVHLRQMAFADSLNGVGIPFGNKLLLTADGGKNWKEQVGPKELRISQISHSGGAESIWAAGSYSGDFTSHGVILHSTDGGQHWVAFKMTAQQIQFVTAQDGWLVSGPSITGSGLLITHDSGATWTNVWPILR